VIATLVTADLARVLGTLRGVAGPAQESVTLLGTSVEAVGLPPGASWEGPPDPGDRLVVVMAGLGTIVVDDWRATAAAGLALAVPAKRRIAALADGRERLELLVVGRAPEAEAALAAPDGAPSSGGEAAAQKTLGDPEPL